MEKTSVLIESTSISGSLVSNPGQQDPAGLVSASGSGLLRGSLRAPSYGAKFEAAVLQEV